MRTGNTAVTPHNVLHAASYSFGPNRKSTSLPPKPERVFSDNYSSLRRQLDFPAQRQLPAPTTITAVG
jgi:hypothetical protein